MSNFVVLKYECEYCHKIDLDNTDTDVYTSWIPGDGFICYSCYTDNNFEGNYECIKLSKYFDIMYNRPCCDNCNRQVTSVDWLYCEKCSYDYCKKCDLSTCPTCNDTLVKDKYNFTE